MEKNFKEAVVKTTIRVLDALNLWNKVYPEQDISNYTWFAKQKAMHAMLQSKQDIDNIRMHVTAIVKQENADEMKTYGRLTRGIISMLPDTLDSFSDMAGFKDGAQNDEESQPHHPHIQNSMYGHDGKNLFDNDYGTSTLGDLKAYRNTVIPYLWLEQFGEDKILHDLEALGFKCSLTVCEDNFVPSSFIHFFYEYTLPYKINMPIMPTVIIALQ